MPDPEKIIYTITIKDVQTVAHEEFGKALTADELKQVENKIENYIDGYEAILSAIHDIRRL